jgi:cytochrome c556
MDMRKALAITAVIVAGSVCGALAPAVISHAASGEDVVKARVKFMDDDIGEHWNVLADFAKNGKGSLADVEKHALALAELSKKIPGHFPKDSGRGVYPDHVTRALPEIWKNWTEFEKQVQQLEAGSLKLASLAKTGDKDAVVKMIGPSGSYAKTQIGCAECHDKFRGARVKK